MTTEALLDAVLPPIPYPSPTTIGAPTPGQVRRWWEQQARAEVRQRDRSRLRKIINTRLGVA